MGGFETKYGHHQNHQKSGHLEDFIRSIYLTRSIDKLLSMRSLYSAHVLNFAGEISSTYEHSSRDWVWVSWEKWPSYSIRQNPVTGTAGCENRSSECEDFIWYHIIQLIFPSTARRENKSSGLEHIIWYHDTIAFFISRTSFSYFEVSPALPSGVSSRVECFIHNVQRHSHSTNC